MVMEHNDSCGSKVVESSPRKSGLHRKKLKVYNNVLRRFKEVDHPEAQEPAFDYHLWEHFNRLPARYAMDVNVDRAEDVLTHKRLLDLARDPANRPAFEVRLVQVLPVSDGNSGDSIHSRQPQKGSIHPPPAFGSCPNLELLALEASNSEVQDGNRAVNAGKKCLRPMHEITFSTVDKPKLLSQLTSLLAEVGLNIQEAHAFSTVDGYSLDVFVVDGWPFEEVEQLQTSLEEEVLKIEKTSWPNPRSLSPLSEHKHVEIKSEPDRLEIPSDGTDVWEMDPNFLKYDYKVASGSYGDLYKGTYCSQEVAIKILKAERLNAELQKEFAQEVYIMRKVRHKNVVQFLGACTRPPNLCIVTEYMSGGSVYDYLHKQKGTFNLPSLLKVAIDVSRGMNYLHQNNIIHRDLKAANLLMDENEVVKVGDFGVARVKAETGVMTAETGTYRWMAPEVIEHKPYDHKVDVFSFGVVLWELLTGQLPYEHLTPLQAAVGVDMILESTPKKICDSFEFLFKSTMRRKMKGFKYAFHGRMMIYKEVFINSISRLEGFGIHSNQVEDHLSMIKVQSDSRMRAAARINARSRALKARGRRKRAAARPFGRSCALGAAFKAARQKGARSRAHITAQLRAAEQIFRNIIFLGFSIILQLSLDRIFIFLNVYGRKFHY